VNHGADASIMTVEHGLLAPALVRRHADGWTAIARQLAAALTRLNPLV
jgi:hypothetical protein